MPPDGRTAEYGRVQPPGRWRWGGADALAQRIKCIYINGVDIDYDPAKDAANIAKHGLSLADAGAFDMAHAVVTLDDRFDYGETRFRAFGRVDGVPHCLVFTWRGGSVRVISYRRAHEKEMIRYEQ